jgi:ABC-type multidrug transport system fused ATPase/permease subunit
VLTLPDLSPGQAPTRSVTGYLGWLARRQWRTLALGLVFGVTWMLSMALAPWAVGRAVDSGLATRSTRGLVIWCGVLTGLGLIGAVAGTFRHRMAVFNWLQASIRTQQQIARHVAEHGLEVSRRVSTGEVVATVTTDPARIGKVFDTTARFSGAIASYFVVGLLVVRIDVLLGAIVMLSSPLLVAAQTSLVRPLQRRQATQRRAEGELTALATDTVAGLRVLRGIGGERAFVARYADRNRVVRDAGIRVARVQSVLDAGQLLAPGLLTVVLTWQGAHAALEHRISTGQLVTLYGYAAFLLHPLSTANEMISALIRARVAVDRVIRVLRITDPTRTEPVAEPVPPPGSPLTDPASGLTVPTGRCTALAAPTPDDVAALALRLARLADPVGGPDQPRLGDVPIDRLPVDRLRERVLVAEAEPRLFSGSLRAAVDPAGRHDDRSVLAALTVADAHDVLDALPDGLDAELTERGRSLSGGQRQRIALARAVLADPEILVLIEPTSAVDVHTEARVATALQAARHGRTTLLVGTSPPLLAAADHVVFLVDGRVADEGRHQDLLALPGYRDAVTRGEAE